MEHHHASSESSAAAYLKFSSIIAAIVALALLLYVQAGSEGVYEFMRWFMGVFLLVFAGFKLVGYNMFVMMFPSYDIIAKRSTLYAKAYPFIELGLGILFIIDAFTLARNLALLAIMGVGEIGVFIEVFRRKSGVHCACLGNIIKLPLSTVSLVENTTMVVMALVMIVREIA